MDKLSKGKVSACSNYLDGACISKEGKSKSCDICATESLGDLTFAATKKSARIVGDCFVKGTLVTTPKGLVPIEELEKGDNIITHSGINEVTELYIMPPTDNE